MGRFSSPTVTSHLTRTLVVTFPAGQKSHYTDIQRKTLISKQCEFCQHQEIAPLFKAYEEGVARLRWFDVVPTSRLCVLDKYLEKHMLFHGQCFLHQYTCSGRSPMISSDCMLWW
ncbi:hypothetical protein HAX54_037687 [Datura stramonium]|uniref:Uncharacterized protein n=1 Tax=Datura stramonium TaxID=4076 RepID=A0ABS8VLH7_DATST|nr:hypothetical protein [Datura stramonium]